jgi:eukaryotic-like serine/threonine-protein kinase
LSASPSIISGEFAGRYTVERELGRGATSIVWLARDLEHSRFVAIKVLRHELSASLAADRFLREIKLTAQLHHPNIVPVLGSGADGDRLFFVLPYMDGGTLRARLEREKQLPISEVVAIGVTVASALASAHEKNVLHRDVKPENILFTGGQACLADFGIARAIDRATTEESTTSTGLVRGTPAYMSPEQATGEKEIDARSDIYSLACVLYEALAGIPAFQGATSQAIVSQRLLHAPRPVSVYRPSVPVQLEEVLQKALAIVPADRYQTAGQFADALMAVPTTPTAEHTMPGQQAARTSPSIRRSAAALGALALVVTSVIWASKAVAARAEAARIDKADSTRLAVFPIESDTLLPWLNSAERTFRDALVAWRGIEVLEPSTVREKLGANDSRLLSSDRLKRTALALKAKRYIRLAASSVADSRQMRGMLFDVARPETPIAEISLLFKTDADLRALADRLLLRPGDTLSISESPRGTNALAAFQAFLRGRAELENWNLATADSAFADALKYDARFGRASLWLALVRWWADSGAATWAHPVEVAKATRDKMPASEQRRLDALVSLRAREYPQACTLLDEETKSAPFDFTAWYSAAKCLHDDNVVIPDPRGRSGWRFRSGYESAIQRYTRALALRPAVIGAFRKEAFAGVRQWLWISSRQLRTGVSVTEPRVGFFAYPSLQDDTLAFVPFVQEHLQSGTSEVLRTLPRSVGLATRRQRELFRDMARSWVASAPASGVAEQALALSLLYLGDQTALDHIRRGKELTNDPKERARLVATELLIRLQLALPHAIAELNAIRHEIDSLLRRGELPPEPRLLASLAAIVGRSSQVVALDAQAQPPGKSVAEARIVSLSRSLALHAALGGPPDTLKSLEREASSMLALTVRPQERAGVEAQLFGQAITLGFPDFLFESIRTRPPANSLHASAIHAALRSDSISAIRILTDAQQVRGALAVQENGMDAIHVEGKILESLGHRPTAVDLIDHALANIRVATFLTDPIQAAMMIRIMMLRAELAAGVGDSHTAARWANAVVALRSGADHWLQPAVNRMRALSVMRNP